MKKYKEWTRKKYKEWTRKQNSDEFVKEWQELLAIVEEEGPDTDQVELGLPACIDLGLVEVMLSHDIITAINHANASELLRLR